jgi:predicted PurR-regulated permease PerM
LEQLKQADKYLPALYEWVSQNKFPQIYQSEEDSKNKTEFYIPTPLTGKIKDQNFSEERPVFEQNSPEFEKHRSHWISNKITTVQMAEWEDTPPIEFVTYLGELVYREYSTSGKIDNLFRNYFNDHKKESNDPHYSYDNFIVLKQALQNSQTSFYEALNTLLGGMDPAEQEMEIQRKFERRKKQNFTDVVVREWEFIEIEKINREIGSWIPKLTILIGHWGIYLFHFMVSFAMSLLLSFFIAFDLPRLRKGIQRLENSRFCDFDQEIAPSLAVFGLIIGRAFHAQGMIAVCNTCMTLILIKFLNLSFEIFLCTIVFFCSFVPILGVVFSTVPIAILAYQEHGIMTSFYAILGIIGIHLIETSILNPKILGDMLKLHPVLILGILVVAEHFFGVWGLLLGVPVMVYIIRCVILGENISSSRG